MPQPGSDHPADRVRLDAIGPLLDGAPDDQVRVTRRWLRAVERELAWYRAHSRPAS